MYFNRESFVFHKDWFNALSTLGDDLRLEVYDAIMRKAFYNEPPELSTTGMLAMSFIEPQIERDYDKWLDIKEKRSNAGKAHKGNQYTMVEQMEHKQANGTNVPTLEQNGTNGTVSVDNISKDNVILKENLKEKEDTKVSLEKKNKRFVKPTIEEIDAYVKEKGYHIDAESFFNFYESKGWVVGKSPMKNWKSACGTWEKTWKEQHPYTQEDDLSCQKTNNPYPQGYWQ